jgi:hypothetical protein
MTLVFKFIRTIQQAEASRSISPHRRKPVPTAALGPGLRPAKAGTQGSKVEAAAPCSCQGQALDPRFRGGDE